MLVVQEPYREKREPLRLDERSSTDRLRRSERSSTRIPSPFDAISIAVFDAISIAILHQHTRRIEVHADQ